VLAADEPPPFLPSLAAPSLATSSSCIVNKLSSTQFLIGLKIYCGELNFFKSLFRN
jgi:hypothetical protein